MPSEITGLDPQRGYLKLGNLVVRQLAGGERLEDEIALSPIGHVIGRDDVATWVPLEERIPYEPLHEGLD